MFQPDISVIVPCLNEEAALPRTLERLAALPVEIIIVDGQSRDRTVEIANAQAHQVLVSTPGRAKQMNLGASHAAGDILFFMHADSRPPLKADTVIRRILNMPGVAAGSFTLKIDHPHPVVRFLNITGNLRARLWQLPYGDQGLFLKKSIFEDSGGFADIPLMEDVELNGRLKKTGRIVITREVMTTSARRYMQTGPIRNTLRNQFRLLRYYTGTSPEKLVSGYRNVR
jgi:rSAM/selenodomain-associated transferase 2